MKASDLVDMLAGPGYAGNAGVAAVAEVAAVAGAAGVAVGHKIDVFAAVHDAVQQASHGLHGCYRRVDLACKQIHWHPTVLDSLVDVVWDRDSSWGVEHCSSRLDGNRSGVVGYALDDEMEHRWERAETRWCVSDWSNWVRFASVRGVHDFPVVRALRGVACRHHHRRRLDYYGH